MNPSPDPQNPRELGLYEQLIEVARQGRTETYFEAARATGLGLDTPDARAAFAALLREISTLEHQADRPLLSALVVLQGNRRPGQGFFDLATELGLLGDQPPEQFHQAEVDRVHRYWAAH